MDDGEARAAHLATCKTKGEAAYDRMYEVHSFREANDCYRDAKEWFEEAIKLAGELGLVDEQQALLKRLAHIRAVFRSQFMP